MQIHQPQNKEYFCSTCFQAFSNNDEYKIHYKSDYHRYNIKRKMVKLPPVTAQQFSTKLQQSKNQAQSKLTCNQCRKTFASVNTFNQHISSKKHNPNAIIQPRQKPSKLPTPFEKNYKKCFFCLKISRDLIQNEEHMQKSHSFFIAQRQFCKNPQGLIEYLQQKIEVGNMCITCENKKAKDFQSADAVRKHMNDRGHSVMKTEQGFEQYQKYYDFSRLFEEKLKQQTQAVPGIQYQKVKVLINDDVQENQNDDQQWQDQDDDDSEEEEEWESDGQQQKQITQQEIEQKKPRVKVYQIMRPTLTANDQLLLPNGKLLGHRKYRHIYKQTLRTPNWLVGQYKQLTNGFSQTSNALIDRRKLMDLLKRQQLISKNVIKQKKHALRVGMTNNGLMRYFRCQNPL